MESARPGVPLKTCYMADFQDTRPRSGNTGWRNARFSTRVDLTPMVDLGFLLITFFVFTTRLSEPKALNLVVPDGGDSTNTGRLKTLNLVLEDNDRVFFYGGDEVWNQSCTDFSPSGLRNVILRYQDMVARRFGSKEELVVLIRPGAGSSYKNLVDTLDEIFITGVKRYVLMDGDIQARPGTGRPPRSC